MFLNKVYSILEILWLYKKAIFLFVLLAVLLFFFYRFKEKLCKLYLEQRKIFSLKRKIILHNFLKSLIYLYEFNFLVPILYFILFLFVLIYVCINWSNFSVIDWKCPRKEAILFIWLIVLSIIPFGNCEILNFKFTTNNMLNNPNAKKLSSKDKKTSDEILESYNKELNEIISQKGGKNVQ